jgi:hypothetical protein
MSCFTWAEHPEGPISAETMSLLTELFSDLYKEAFSRLPIEDMPDLHFDPHMSVMCVGLLDPVTNIILNTFSSLSDDDYFGGSFPFGRSRSTLREISRGGREQWYSMVYMSIRILIEFMRTYFRLLSEEQAGRYLLWARGDLALAVLFVEHELYLEHPAIPDPRSPRTRFSFQLAVEAASHPAPDYLAWLSTLWLPQHQLETLAPILIPRNRKLTVDDVWTISSVLRSHGRPPQRTPFSSPQGPLHHSKDCVDLGDGRIGFTTVVQLPGDYITSLRHHPDIRSMLSNYREDAMDTLPRTWRKPCEVDSPNRPNGTICLYVRSMKMFLQGTIHGFYLKALAKLSSRHACRLMRAILIAGHCYGPMDPVSNIIVTAIWYDMKFPPPPLRSGGPSLEHDMLDTLSILRTECCSFVGLVALFCDTVSDKSFHLTLKSLCHMKCDLSTEVQRHLQSMQSDGSSPNPFAAATAAAQHPQSSALAEFLVSLSPMKLRRLHSLTSPDSTLSDDSFRQIFDIIGGPASAMPEVFPLRDNALSMLSKKRSDHADLRRFIREQITHLLQKYAYHHPMEPKYELVCICGVDVIGHRQSSYHINFMAAAAGSRSENTLFFADLSVSFCCPVPQPCTGRCYYGEVSATKIVYPDMIRYFSCDVTCGGTGQPETPLETDYIFADLGRDLKLVKALQRSADEQEAVCRGLYIREEFLHTEDPEWWNDYDVPEWYDEY